MAQREIEKSLTPEVKKPPTPKVAVKVAEQQFAKLKVQIGPSPFTQHAETFVLKLRDFSDETVKPKFTLLAGLKFKELQSFSQENIAPALKPALDLKPTKVAAFESKHEKKLEEVKAPVVAPRVAGEPNLASKQAEQIRKEFRSVVEALEAAKPKMNAEQKSRAEFIIGQAKEAIQEPKPELLSKKFESVSRMVLRHGQLTEMEKAPRAKDPAALAISRAAFNAEYKGESQRANALVSTFNLFLGSKKDSTKASELARTIVTAEKPEMAKNEADARLALRHLEKERGAYSKKARDCYRLAVEFYEKGWQTEGHLAYNLGAAYSNAQSTSNVRKREIKEQLQAADRQASLLAKSLKSNKSLAPESARKEVSSNVALARESDIARFNGSMDDLEKKLKRLDPKNREITSANATAAREFYEAGTRGKTKDGRVLNEEEKSIYLKTASAILTAMNGEANLRSMRFASATEAAGKYRAVATQYAKVREGDLEDKRIALGDAQGMIPEAQRSGAKAAEENRFRELKTSALKELKESENKINAWRKEAGRAHDEKGNLMFRAESWLYEIAETRKKFNEAKNLDEIGKVKFDISEANREYGKAKLVVAVERISEDRTRMIESLNESIKGLEVYDKSNLSQEDKANVTLMAQSMRGMRAYLLSLKIGDYYLKAQEGRIEQSDVDLLQSAMGAASKSFESHRNNWNLMSDALSNSIVHSSEAAKIAGKVDFKIPLMEASAQFRRASREANDANALSERGFQMPVELISSRALKYGEYTVFDRRLEGGYGITYVLDKDNKIFASFHYHTEGMNRVYHSSDRKKSESVDDFVHRQIGRIESGSCGWHIAEAFMKQGFPTLLQPKNDKDKSVLATNPGLRVSLKWLAGEREATWTALIRLKTSRSATQGEIAAKQAYMDELDKNLFLILRYVSYNKKDVSEDFFKVNAVKLQTQVNEAKARPGESLRLLREFNKENTSHIIHMEEFDKARELAINIGILAASIPFPVLGTALFGLDVAHKMATGQADPALVAMFTLSAVTMGLGKAVQAGMRAKSLMEAGATAEHLGKAGVRAQRFLPYAAPAAEIFGGASAVYGAGYGAFGAISATASLSPDSTILDYASTANALLIGAMGMRPSHFVMFGKKVRTPAELEAALSRSRTETAIGESQRIIDARNKGIVPTGTSIPRFRELEYQAAAMSPKELTAAETRFIEATKAGRTKASNVNEFRISELAGTLGERQAARPEAVQKPAEVPGAPPSAREIGRAAEQKAIEAQKILEERRGPAEPTPRELAAAKEAKRREMTPRELELERIENLTKSDIENPNISADGLRSVAESRRRDAAEYRKKAEDIRKEADRYEREFGKESRGYRDFVDRAASNEEYARMYERTATTLERAAARMESASAKPAERTAASVIGERKPITQDDAHRVIIERASSQDQPAWLIGGTRERVGGMELTLETGKILRAIEDNVITKAKAGQETDVITVDADKRGLNAINNFAGFENGNLALSAYREILARAISRAGSDKFAIRPSPNGDEGILVITAPKGQGKVVAERLQIELEKATAEVLRERMNPDHPESMSHLRNAVRDETFLVSAAIKVGEPIEVRKQPDGSVTARYATDQRNAMITRADGRVEFLAPAVTMTGDPHFAPAVRERLGVAHESEIRGGLEPIENNRVRDIWERRTGALKPEERAAINEIENTLRTQNLDPKNPAHVNIAIDRLAQNRSNMQPTETIPVASVVFEVRLSVPEEIRVGLVERLAETGKGLAEVLNNHFGIRGLNTFLGHYGANRVINNIEASVGAYAEQRGLRIRRLGTMKYVIEGGTPAEVKGLHTFIDQQLQKNGLQLKVSSMSPIAEVGAGTTGQTALAHVTNGHLVVERRADPKRVTNWNGEAVHYENANSLISAIPIANDQVLSKLLGKHYDALKPVIELVRKRGDIRNFEDLIFALRDSTLGGPNGRVLEGAFRAFVVENGAQYRTVLEQMVPKPAPKPAEPAQRAAALGDLGVKIVPEEAVRAKMEKPGTPPPGTGRMTVERMAAEIARERAGAEVPAAGQVPRAPEPISKPITSEASRMPESPEKQKAAQDLNFARMDLARKRDSKAPEAEIRAAEAAVRTASERYSAFTEKAATGTIETKAATAPGVSQETVPSKATFEGGVLTISSQGIKGVKGHTVPEEYAAAVLRGEFPKIDISESSGKPGGLWLSWGEGWGKHVIEVQESMPGFMKGVTFRAEIEPNLKLFLLSNREVFDRMITEFRKDVKEVKVPEGQEPPKNLWKYETSSMREPIYYEKSPWQWLKEKGYDGVAVTKKAAQRETDVTKERAGLTGKRGTLSVRDLFPFDAASIVIFEPSGKVKFLGGEEKIKVGAERLRQEEVSAARKERKIWEVEQRTVSEINQPVPDAPTVESPLTRRAVETLGFDDAHSCFGNLSLERIREKLLKKGFKPEEITQVLKENAVDLWMGYRALEHKLRDSSLITNIRNDGATEGKAYLEKRGYPSEAANYILRLYLPEIEAYAKRHPEPIIREISKSKVAQKPEAPGVAREAAPGVEAARLGVVIGKPSEVNAARAVGQEAAQRGSLPTGRVFKEMAVQEAARAKAAPGVAGQANVYDTISGSLRATKKAAEPNVGAVESSPFQKAMRGAEWKTGDFKYLWPAPEGARVPENLQFIEINGVKHYILDRAEPGATLYMRETPTKLVRVEETRPAEVAQKPVEKPGIEQRPAERKSLDHLENDVLQAESEVRRLDNELTRIAGEKGTPKREIQEKRLNRKKESGNLGELTRTERKILELQEAQKKVEQLEPLVREARQEARRTREEARAEAPPGVEAKPEARSTPEAIEMAERVEKLTFEEYNKASTKLAEARSDLRIARNPEKIAAAEVQVLAAKAEYKIAENNYKKALEEKENFVKIGQAEGGRLKAGEIEMRVPAPKLSEEALANANKAAEAAFREKNQAAVQAEDARIELTEAERSKDPKRIAEAKDLLGKREEELNASSQKYEVKLASRAKMEPEAKIWEVERRVLGDSRYIEVQKRKVQDLQGEIKILEKEAFATLKERIRAEKAMDEVDKGTHEYERAKAKHEEADQRNDNALGKLEEAEKNLRTARMISERIRLGDGAYLNKLTNDVSAARDATETARKKIRNEKSGLDFQGAKANYDHLNQILTEMKQEMGVKQAPAPEKAPAQRSAEVTGRGFKIPVKPEAVSAVESKPVEAKTEAPAAAKTEIYKTKVNVEEDLSLLRNLGAEGKALAQKYEDVISRIPADAPEQVRVKQQLEARRAVYEELGIKLKEIPEGQRDVIKTSSLYENDSLFALVLHGNLKQNVARFSGIENPKIEIERTSTGITGAFKVTLTGGVEPVEIYIKQISMRADILANQLFRDTGIITAQIENVPYKLPNGRTYEYGIIRDIRKMPNVESAAPLLRLTPELKKWATDHLPEIYERLGYLFQLSRIRGRQDLSSNNIWLIRKKDGSLTLGMIDMDLTLCYPNGLIYSKLFSDQLARVNIYASHDKLGLQDLNSIKLIGDFHRNPNPENELYRSFLKGARDAHAFDIKPENQDNFRSAVEAFQGTVGWTRTLEVVMGSSNGTMTTYYEINGKKQKLREDGTFVPDKKAVMQHYEENLGIDPDSYWREAIGNQPTSGPLNSVQF